LLERKNPIDGIGNGSRDASRAFLEAMVVLIIRPNVHGKSWEDDAPNGFEGVPLRNVLRFEHIDMGKQRSQSTCQFVRDVWRPGTQEAFRVGN
jgi:hypothetical protein